MKDVSAREMGELVVREVIKRAGIEPYMVDEVIFAKARQAGQGPNIARQISVGAGIPVEKPAYTVNQACLSSVQSLILAYKSIVLGDADIVVAGGTESMSRVPYMLDRARFDGYRLGHGTLIDGMYQDGFLDPLSGQLMGRTAENLVEMYNITREEQDAYALESHRRAVGAKKDGRFVEEIVPVPVRGKRGEVTLVKEDEHPREDASLDKMAKLPPVFKEGGTVTAGNSSAITDGAAALLVMSKERAKGLGIEPMAKVGPYTVVGVEPRIMGIGPVPATKKLLAKTGMKLSDFELIELNEAFAAQVLAVARELPFDFERTNVNGGAIALGHPIACTGARLVTTLLYEMKRRNLSTGLVTLCVSGGMGGSIVFFRE